MMKLNPSPTVVEANNSPRPSVVNTSTNQNPKQTQRNNKMYKQWLGLQAFIHDIL
tara:strand:- start:7162 stop:7326 length:165 start_codon:yes stop_codon:yes gene_type:complete